MGKKGDLSDFEHGIVVGDNLLGFSRTISRVNREWSKKEKVSAVLSENALLMAEVRIRIRLSFIA